MISEKWIKKSVGLRIFIIGALTLLLFIPSLMIMGLVNEREDRKREVEVEVSSKWGDNQILAGPILTVPFLQHYITAENKTASRKNYLHLLPETLNVEGLIDPIIRYRGIFKVVLYSSQLNFNGQFNIEEILDKKINPDDFLFDESFISFGVTDMRGIKDEISLDFEKQIIDGEPGLISKDIIESGVSFDVSIGSSERIKKFNLNLNLNGSQTLKIVPVGKETKVNLKSSWINPSFNGEYLPVKREINKDGFIAKWKILHFNRNYPQQWVSNKYKIESSSFGVELLSPIDSYRNTHRTIKYAILFIGLTFLAFFMVEILNEKLLHPIQYVLIGFALVLFYSLLLSTSEHMAFAIAYILSSLSIVGIITFYSKFIMKSSKLAISLGTFISVFYAFLYILLQLEDYSILVGSIGLLLILGIIMYVTRNIDWFTVLEPNNEEQT